MQVEWFGDSGTALMLRLVVRDEVVVAGLWKLASLFGDAQVVDDEGDGQDIEDEDE